MLIMLSAPIRFPSLSLNRRQTLPIHTKLQFMLQVRYARHQQWKSIISPPIQTQDSCAKHAFHLYGDNHFPIQYFKGSTIRETYYSTTCFNQNIGSFFHIHDFIVSSMHESGKQAPVKFMVPTKIYAITALKYILQSMFTDQMMSPLPSTSKLGPKVVANPLIEKGKYSQVEQRKKVQE